MRSKRRFWFLALIPILALVWAMKSAASWRPSVFVVQSNAVYPLSTFDRKWLLVDTTDNIAGFSVWDLNTRQLLWKRDSRDKWLCNSSKNAALLIARGRFALPEQLTSLSSVRLELHDLHDGRFLRAFEGGSDNEDAQLLAYDFSSDETELRIITSQSLRRWNVASGRLVLNHRWERPKSGKQITAATFFTLSEKIIAFDGGLFFMDARTGKITRRLSVLCEPPLRFDSENFLEVSPDDFSFFEARSDTDNSRVFRMSDGKQLWRGSDWLNISADGQEAYVPAKNGLDVFDAHTGRRLRQLPGPKEYGFDASSDGNWIYEARAGKIYRWRAR